MVGELVLGACFGPHSLQEFWETYKTERTTQIRASVSLFTFVTVLTVVIIPGHAFSLASTWLSVVLGRVLPVAAIIVSCVSTSNPLWKRYWPYTTSICMTAAVASVIAFLYHCATSEPSLESLGCKYVLRLSHATDVPHDSCAMKSHVK